MVGRGEGGAKHAQTMSFNAEDLPVPHRDQPQRVFLWWISGIPQAEGAMSGDGLGCWSMPPPKTDSRGSARKRASQSNDNHSPISVEGMPANDGQKGGGMA